MKTKNFLICLIPCIYACQNGNNFYSGGSCLENGRTKKRTTNGDTQDEIHIKWTPEEDERLMELVDILGKKWDVIVLEFRSHTARQCRDRYNLYLNNSYLTAGPWTEYEDTLLLNLQKQFGNKWIIISQYFPQRTYLDCKVRYRKILKKIASPKMTKWTVKECQTLEHAVNVFGNDHWDLVATMIPGRSQTQCKEKWINIHCSRKAWTLEENQILFEKRKQFDNDWIEISKSLPYRTPSSCARHFRYIFEERKKKICSIKSSTTKLPAPPIHSQPNTPPISRRKLPPISSLLGDSVDDFSFINI